jgi:hypothetical protein
VKEANANKPARRQSSPGATISIIAVAFVMFMVLYIYTGPLKRYQISERSLSELRLQLKDLKDQKFAEEERLRNQESIMARLKERKANFDLWSFMNTVLAETKLKDRANLENYKPRGDWRGTDSSKEAMDDVMMVQLRLNGVTLLELVDLLHKIYDSNNLVLAYKLEYLHPGGEGKGLECNVVFLTPKA